MPPLGLASEPVEDDDLESLEYDPSLLEEVKTVGRKRRSVRWYVIFFIHMTLFAGAIYYAVDDIAYWYRQDAWRWTNLGDVVDISYEPVGNPNVDEWIGRLYQFAARVHVSLVLLALIGVVSIINVWLVLMWRRWRRFGGWGRVFGRGK